MGGVHRQKTCSAPAVWPSPGSGTASSVNSRSSAVMSPWGRARNIHRRFRSSAHTASLSSPAHPTGLFVASAHERDVTRRCQGADRPPGGGQRRPLLGALARSGPLRAGRGHQRGFERAVGHRDLRREPPLGWSGPQDRPRVRPFRQTWWGVPFANTDDLAAAMAPSLMYRRLDELGLDLAVCYPTWGLVVPSQRNDEIRQGLCRAWNRYTADVYDGFGDRLVPVATIPTTTPQEAVDELDHAVVDLGLQGGDAGRLRSAGPRRRGHLDRLAGPRQRLRLRPAMAAAGGVGRGGRFPLRVDGVERTPVHHQFLLQPHGQLSPGPARPPSSRCFSAGCCTDSPTSGSTSWKEAQPGRCS